MKEIVLRFEGESLGMLECTEVIVDPALDAMGLDDEALGELLSRVGADLFEGLVRHG